MGNTIFINEAVNTAIANYLNYKSNPKKEEFSAFITVVIRALVLIYGELDIVNPYKTNSERGFDTNLMKFGFSEVDLNLFKEQLLLFYKNPEDDVICKNAFLSIQKYLIDMFVLRKSQVLVSEEEVEEFKSLLYTKNDVNPFKFVLYNKYTPDSDELLHYFSLKMFEIKHSFVFTEYQEITLGAEAYQLAGFNAVEVMHMKEEEILNVNNKVYHFFRIKENDEDKRSRLKNAIQYYKRYGNSVTSGNGYVDLLLLLGIVATGLMVVVLIGIRFMR